MTESSKPPDSNSSDPFSPVGFWKEKACWVNLHGDYSYLTAGYYASQDLESTGLCAHPTCKEILDGMIVPLFLEKASLHKIKAPEYYITNAYFEPPVLVDTINPFMSRQSIVWETGHQERISKSLSRNFKYSICCQELPKGSRIGHFRMVLGQSAKPEYQELATKVWEVFCFPAATVRVIVLKNHKALLSGLKPLPFHTLTQHELALINQKVLWRK
ncbi:RimK-like ATPgrasp N-terminal domain-containing protein [Candidatus Acetothermia bacterium]|nr:RimK-like ATPgrasp N-terminal domain-containing protein [Candidatus Acetothermia bacterium]MBI3644208.1 RimK-like ATPgrasp N-terminal domain-containing protein [Candidatus Acetothermia bacterium]